MALIRANWRHWTALLMASLLLVCAPVSAMEYGLPAWLWFMRFDGTPNAVRGRFNELAKDRAEEGLFQSWPKLPGAASAASVGADRFVFYDGAPDEAMVAGPVRYTLSGEMDGRGMVVRLQIDIEPSDQFSQEYLTGCDQLAQILALSLFDALEERTAHNLMLALLYDLRPFSYHDSTPLKPRARALTTAVDGALLQMEWAVEAGDRMRFCAALGGTATEQQAQDAQANNRCNRLLSQTSDECGALMSCLREMIAQLQGGDLDWADLRAEHNQVRESASVMAELQRALLAHGKSREYASRLSAQLPAIHEALRGVEAALEARDTAALRAALDTAVAQGGAAHRLIGLIRAR